MAIDEIVLTYLSLTIIKHYISFKKIQLHELAVPNTVFVSSLVGPCRKYLIVLKFHGKYHSIYLNNFEIPKVEVINLFP